MADARFDESASVWDRAMDQPPYPEAMGTILHNLLHPTPLDEQAGPPWTHTLTAKPDCDLDDCCDTDGPCACTCHRPQPTHTLERYE